MNNLFMKARTVSLILCHNNHHHYFQLFRELFQHVHVCLLYWINLEIQLCVYEEQYHNLMELFRIGGAPTYTSYFFTSDYLDHGYYFMESESLLVCWKVQYLDCVFVLQGNHESCQITQVYGFTMNVYTNTAVNWWTSQ